MNDVIFGQKFANELQNESPSTIKCLERIPPELFGWKPHERSMALGYLAALIAEIPKWVAYIVKQDEIDLATFPHDQPKTSQDLVNNFNKNVADAHTALTNIKEGVFDETFYLRSNGQELYRSTKLEQVGSSINHMIHHRGQLTVYMRLNNIAVPSIYGPSADDKSFA